MALQEYTIEQEMMDRVRVAEKEAEKRGEKRGKKEGILEGKIEGILEGKIEIVKEMLKENIPLENIIKISKLSKEQIQEIQKELHS